MLKPSAFHAYDIRGITLADFDAAGAFAIGRGFGLFLKSEEREKVLRVVVQRDARSYGEELMHALITGLLSTGVDVIDGGFATTPMHYFSINHADTDGGIMITASHNPPEYNGFKLSGRGAIPIGMGSGLEKVQEIACEQEGASATDRLEGKRLSQNFEEVYKDFLYSLVDLGAIGKLHAVADASNGMTGLLLRDIFKAIPNIQVDLLHTEINMKTPSHIANPIVPEGIAEAQGLVKKTGAEIGFAFDGDGDRIGIVDEQGRRVRNDIIGALLATHFLEQQKGETIIYDVRSTRAFPEAVLASGGKPIKECVGHSFIKQRMHKEDALFAAEYTGHFYYRDFFYADAAILTMLHVLHLLSVSGKSLSELTKQFSSRYADCDQINLQIDAQNALVQIEQAFKNRAIDRTDGLSIDVGDYWFNVRSSNTGESLVRINIEAKDDKALEKGKQQLGEILGQKL